MRPCLRLRRAFLLLPLLGAAACRGDGVNMGMDESDAGVDAASAGDASDSDAQDAGDDAGTLGGGDDAGAEEDDDASTAPDPREDLTGLIPTSGSHAAFMASTGELYDQQYLYGLDLVSGQKHELTTAPIWYVDSEVSPDSTTLFYGNPNGIVYLNLFLARFTDKGIVPGQSLAEVLPCDGNQGFVSWFPGSRYSLWECRDLADKFSLQIMDAWTRKMHWSDANAMSEYARGKPAPIGDWFTYRLDNTSKQDKLGRVTDTGVESELLEGGFRNRIFDPTGTKIAYVIEDSVSHVARVYQKPVVGPPALWKEVANVESFGIDGYDPTGTRLLGYQRPVGGTTQVIAFDGLGVTLLSDPARTSYIRRMASDWKTVLVVYEDPDTWAKEVVLRDATGALSELSVVSGQSIVTDVHGRYFSYTLDMGDSFWLVRRSDTNELINVRVTEPGEKNFICDSYNTPEPPADKLVLRDGPTSRLILLDIGGEMPKRVSTIEPAQGYTLSCPQWSPKGDSFAYAESSQDKGSRIHQVTWGKGAPTSKIIYDGTERISDVLLFRP